MPVCHLWNPCRARPVRWAALLLPLCLLWLSGCGDTPQPPANQAENTPEQWNMYVTRHLGRGMGRLQFAVPPGWRVTYQHDIAHPRMILANRGDLQAPDVSFLIIGLTEEEVFKEKKFDGPPAVWNAADYSPETDPVKREKLDRREIVQHNGHQGEGVRWFTTQTTPTIGDWEYVWKHGVDPGPTAVDRNAQRVNKYDEYLQAHPGAAVDSFREYYTYGWGVRPKSWMQIYYKAHNDSIRRMIEAVLPTVDEFRLSDSALVSVDIGLLGGMVPRAAWDRLNAAPPPAATAPAASAAATPPAP